MNKEAYTKIFLKEKGMAMSEANIKQYMPLWWRNIRNKEKGGLRLTEDGFDLLSEIGIELYDIPYPKDMPLTTNTVLQKL